MMGFRPAVHVPLIFAVLGVAFLVPGLRIAFSHASERAAARGAALATVTATTLGTHAVGEVVLLEGRLAAGNRAVFREFIACQRDRFAGIEPSGPSKGRERWTPMATLSPPLVVNTAGGPVGIVNQGYELRDPPHRWWDKPIIIDALGKSGERANGFFAGDVVTVEGRVAAPPAAGVDNHPNMLEAQVLFGGDQAAYVAQLRGGVLATRILGGVFSGVGLVLLLIAGWLRRRMPRDGKGVRRAR